MSFASLGTSAARSASTGQISGAHPPSTATRGSQQQGSQQQAISKGSSTQPSSAGPDLTTSNDAPMAIMPAEERLVQVRCALTRIEHVLEQHRHLSVLLPEVPASHDVMLKIGDALRKELLVPTSKAAQHAAMSGVGKCTPCRRDRCHELLQLVNAEVAAEAAAQAGSHLASAPSQPTAAGGIGNGEQHDGNRIRLLLLSKLQAELQDIALLLGPDPLPSRRDDAHGQLLQLVSHFKEDYRELIVTRLPAYFREALAERHYASAIVEAASVSPSSPTPMAAGHPAEPPLVSVFGIDLVVGCEGARAARPAIDNTFWLINTALSRSKDEQRVLQALESNNLPLASEQLATQASGEDDVDDSPTLVEAQLEAVKMIAMELNHCHQRLTSLREAWNHFEGEIVNRATMGEDLDMLQAAKQLKELEIIDQVCFVGRRVNGIACCFLGPQYCRRKELTYSVACHFRIGVRAYCSSTKRWATITNASSATVRHDGVTPIPPYLLPSSQEFWFNYDAEHRFPLLVRGLHCALQHTAAATTCSAEVSAAVGLEEPRELGGYFIMKGGERILRTLLMQRCNVAINMERERFSSIGPGFSSKAVVVRCKRQSGLTCVNYLYYVDRGEIIFTFARKVAWQIPASLILMCCASVTPTAIFQLLTAGRDDIRFIARVEAFMLSFAATSYGSLTGGVVQFLAVLGRKYRQYYQSSVAPCRFIPELALQTVPHADAWYGLYMMRRHVLPHLNCDAQTPDASTSVEDTDWPGPDIRSELLRKFDALIEMIRQLHDFVGGAKVAQGNDVPSFQEVFMPSHIMLAAVSQSVSRFLKVVAQRLGRQIPAGTVRQLCERPHHDRSLRQLQEYVKACKVSEPLSTVHKIIQTGNFATEGDEDFFTPQNSGWAVQAEHLNFFRFVEQLRTLHRGKRIADMRSAEVRKFPNEAFGFLCMAHSHDGEDCGVVNYMSTGVTITTCSEEQLNQRHEFLQAALSDLHISQVQPGMSSCSDRLHHLPVWVDGSLVAFANTNDASKLVELIRSRKQLRCNSRSVLSPDRAFFDDSDREAAWDIEVVLVPPSSDTPAGVFIFCSASRIMRSVVDLRTGCAVKIGAWEQIWMDIAGVCSEIVDAKRDLGRTFHYMEDPAAACVSLTSLTIPFFEHNCSPRNLFQCGLSKQSAGTQLLATAWRREAKLFRMMTPQRYIVRTLPMDDFLLDDFALGVNATVAVLSYTGFDMDDAVIINHTAVERGLFHTVVTIAKVVDLRKLGVSRDSTGRPNAATVDDEVVVFHNVTDGGVKYCPDLQANGLPLPRVNAAGFRWNRDHSTPGLLDDTAVYCTARRKRAADGCGFEYFRHSIQSWKHMDKGENAWVHNVVPLEFDGSDVTKALFVFRIPRNPIVGDKFSSRHGQKGTLPLNFRSVDLPWTSEGGGFSPDVIINPHAFPSRMTVGMLLEIMAGKLGALQGRFFDNTPWSAVDEDPVVAKQVGAALVKAGFSRHGRERMYCGQTGVLMEADVFVGIAGYQRLRHMVSDKWQARARSDVHHGVVTKTGQPVKGRKRHGGVRVGEMERDGLLSHGLSEVVLDRLMRVSDQTKAFLCFKCGGMVAVHERHTSRQHSVKGCRYCENNSTATGEATTDAVALIDIPQVLRLWCCELACVGVRVTFKMR